MSGGTQVETNALGRAGQQMLLAASGAGSANPSDDLAGIGEAIPGSQSAGAAQTLTATWQRRFADWKSDAEGHGTSMVDSAATYVSTDVGAAQAQSTGGQP